MKLGIIGYGNIAKAMVAGLDGKFNPIYVNDRKPQSKKAYKKKSLQDFKIDDIEKIRILLKNLKGECCRPRNLYDPHY